MQQPGDVVIRWQGEEVSFDQPWERDLFEYLKNTLPAEFAIGNLPGSVRHELDGPDEQNTARALAVILVQTQFLAGRRQGEITQSVFKHWMAAFLTDRMLTTDPQLLDEDDPGAGFVLSSSRSSKQPFQMATVLNAWIGAGFPVELDLPTAEDRDDRWLRIEGVGDFLSWVPSRGGRFRVAWRDGHHSNNGWVSGQWALLDGEKLLSYGRVARPMAASVSDVGRFVLADSTTGSALQGDFFVIEWNGTAYLRHRYTANLGTVGISADGRFAAVSTAASDTEDSTLLALWDLGLRREAWRRKVFGVLGNRAIEFDPDGSLIRLSVSGNQRLDFHLDGRLAIDDPSFIDWVRTQSSAWITTRIVDLRREELGERLAEAGAAELLSLGGPAVERSTDHDQRARLLRKLGEICEEVGWTDRTITYWRRAVELNPNVGVKRMLKKLDAAFAETPIAKGKLVVRVEGCLTPAGDWKAGSRVALLQPTGRGRMVAALGTTAKHNVVCVDLKHGEVVWQEKVPGRAFDVSPWDQGWLLAGTEGTVQHGTTSVWRLAPPDPISRLAEVPAYPTSIAVAADRVFVGGRDGFLYCLNLDGSPRWRHQVGRPSSDPMEIQAPYEVTVNPVRGEVLYASWGMMRTLDFDGKELWRLGKGDPLGLDNFGLLIDRFYVGPRGELLIQRRNLRVSLRLPDGEMKSPMGGLGELEVKGVDWHRGWFWARDGSGLVIVDLGGNVVRRAAQAGMGWAHPAVLQADGSLLVTWRGSQFQLWNDELEQIGSGEVFGETISVAAFAPEGEVMLGTSKRALRVTAEPSSC